MIIDSGASVNVIREALWDQLKKRSIKCVTKRSIKKLHAYVVVKALEVIRTFIADIILGTKCVPAEVTVVKGQGEAL